MDVQSAHEAELTQRCWCKIASVFWIHSSTEAESCGTPLQWVIITGVICFLFVTNQWKWSSVALLLVVLVFFFSQSAELILLSLVRLFSFHLSKKKQNKTKKISNNQCRWEIFPDVLTVWQTLYTWKLLNSFGAKLRAVCQS